MKKQPALSFFLLLIFYALPGKLLAQHNPVLESFTATQTNGKVFLTWVMSSGSTCNGIDILRSTDSLSFYPIGNIAGTCGSITIPVTYQFTDDSPAKNKTNYYRLNLGGNGSSQILSIQIIDITNGYSIRPHPVNNNALIYFPNPSNKQHQLTIYNQHAQKIKTLTTLQNYFPLNATPLPTGTYLFTITNPQHQTIAKNKFIVQN